jgi:glycerol uptake facilitator protein
MTVAASTPSLSARCFAETIGTFILVFFGCGAVHTAVLLGAQQGLWQVAIVWGVAIMIAVYVVGGISGAHINPAITLALASWGRFSWSLVVPYVVSQVVGAMLAAATLHLLFGPFLKLKEEELGLVRGQPGSELTAMCYGEYFPNPGRLESNWKQLRSAADPSVLVPDDDLNATRKATLDQHHDLVSEPVAFFAEVLGTLILALVVFAVTDERNIAAPTGRLAPVFIGLTVAILISVIAPLTQACFNPARDFGPRLVACFAGWGQIALPGPRGLGFLTVYIIAPSLGAILGGGLFSKLLRPALPAPAPDSQRTT